MYTNIVIIISISSTSYLREIKATDEGDHLVGVGIIHDDRLLMMRV